MTERNAASDSQATSNAAELLEQGTRLPMIRCGHHSTRVAQGRSTPGVVLALTALVFAVMACGGEGERTAAPSAASVEHATAATTETATAPRPRLVILISVDTLRADHLGLYGYERFTSPSLDLLGLEGTVFDDASAAAPWTLPSHASMLTGLFPMTNHVVTVETALPAETPTIASLLAEQGYETGAVVSAKWLRRDQYNLTKDFDRYLFVETRPQRRTPSSWITDQALEWIDDVGDEKLFLLLHYFDVHSDYASEEGYEKLFVEPYDGIADGTSWQLLKSNLEPGYIEMCQREFDEKRCTFGSKVRKRAIDESFEPVVFDEADAKHLIDLYDAGIRQMDSELSRLFAALRQRGLLDETLLIVVSDHGEEFLDHGRVDHFLTTYQEILRVPLIFRGPGIPAGKRVDTPVSLVDLVPTILELTGAPPARHVEGLSLVPLFRGEDDAAYRQRYIYGEAPGGLTYQATKPGLFPIIQSVRRDRWKLVYDATREEYDLFDLESDPDEKVDVSEQQPQIAAQLIEEMQQRYGDFAPSELPNANVELSEEELEELRALGYVP